MTSRRSRLKAVTNLPIRRKAPTAHGNTNDTTLVESPTSEKVFACNAESDEILTAGYNSHSNNSEGKNPDDTSHSNKRDDSLINVNCTAFQSINGGNLDEESESIKVNEFDCSQILKGSNDLTKASDLQSYKTDSNSGLVFKSDHNFKLNSVSSLLKGKAPVQAIDNIKADEILMDQGFISFNKNDNSNINNNIVKDGLKYYTVLTPQSVTLTSLAEYTITPLACEDNYIATSVNDDNIPQQFEEVQIFTEVEPAELYINNDINDNSESLIETGSLEPVLTSLTNCNSVQEMHNINYETINSNLVQFKNNSENLVISPVEKNIVANVKTNLSGNDKQCKSLITQVKDSSVMDKGVSSASFKVSCDVSSYKQMSTARKKRAKYTDYTKKLADAKREFQKKYEKTKPDRSSLKMIDLIFYNPSSNPMESKTKFERKDMLEHTSELVNDLLVEEKVDEPELLDSNSKSNMSESNETDSTNIMPVPQVKIGLDGEIILDEKSLIIETTDAKKGRQGLQNSVPVFEDRSCKVSYYRGKSKKTRDWTDLETKRFYKALNTIGPDFTLMQKYFPKRSRLELKNKFKREERLNRSLIDKALNNPSEFDMTQLEKDLAVEKEAEEGIEMGFCRIVKQAAKKPKIKSSLLSREMVELDGEIEKNHSSSFYDDPKKLSEKERNKKEKEFDFVFHNLLIKESRKSAAMLPEISLSPNVLKNSDHVMS